MSTQPYLANALFNHIFRAVSFTAPSHCYIALFINGIEVSGGGYARQDCHGSGAWTSPSNGAGSNVAAITFPVASAPWGTVDSYGIYDASSGGNLMIFDTLKDAGGTAAPKPIAQGDQFIWPANQFIQAIL